MELLLKNSGTNRKARPLNVLTINKSSVAISEATKNINGLKNHDYFSIGKLSNGILVAIFSDKQRKDFYKLRSPYKTSFNVSVNKSQSRLLSNYIGHYTMKSPQKLMEDCICFPLSLTTI